MSEVILGLVVLVMMLAMILLLFIVVFSLAMLIFREKAQKGA